MNTRLRVTPLLVAAGLLSGCHHGWGPALERRTEKTFQAPAGSVVTARIGGGPITVRTGPEGEIRVELLEQVYASSDRDADEVLRDIESDVSQQRNEVRVTARRRSGEWRFWREGQVHFNATLTVPPNVRLDLDTSGGSIRVRGDRTAETRANTSGGSVEADGGAGPIKVETSGGSIRIGHALSTLDAETSGGGITVGYVGPEARNVAVNTSGGSIRIGVDPAASLDVSASTSGGRVSVKGLPLEASDEERSSVVGKLNGGGGHLRATTSGGGIDLTAAPAPRRAESSPQD